MLQREYTHEGARDVSSILELCDSAQAITVILIACDWFPSQINHLPNRFLNDVILHQHRRKTAKEMLSTQKKQQQQQYCVYLAIRICKFTYAKSNGFTIGFMLQVCESR